jgi:hypothetical protein
MLRDEQHSRARVSPSKHAFIFIFRFYCDAQLCFSCVLDSNSDLAKLMSDEKLSKPELLDQCVAYSQPEVVVRRLARDLIRLLLVRSAFDLTVYVRGFPRRSILDSAGNDCGPGAARLHRHRG